MRKNLLDRETKLLRNWKLMIQLRNYWKSNVSNMTHSKKKIIDACETIESVITEDMRYLIQFEYLRFKSTLYDKYERIINRFLSMDDNQLEKNIYVVPIAIYRKDIGLFISNDDIAFQKKFSDRDYKFSIERKTNKSLTVLVKTLEEIIILKICNIKKIKTFNDLCYILLENKHSTKDYLDIKIINPRHYMEYNNDVRIYETNKALFNILRKNYSGRVTNYYLEHTFNIKMSDEYQSRILKHCVNPDKIYYGVENFAKTGSMNDFIKRFKKIKKAKYNTHIIKKITRRFKKPRIKNK